MRFGMRKALLCAAIGLIGIRQMRAQDKLHWVGSWASSQQTPETGNLLDPELMRDATLRQIVPLSLGGSQLRVRVSNAFGTAPLRLTSVHVARPVPAGGGAIDPSTDTAVIFDGAPDVMIPLVQNMYPIRSHFQPQDFRALRSRFTTISRRQERRDILGRGLLPISRMVIWFRLRAWRMQRRWSTGTKSRVSMWLRLRRPVLW